MCLRWTHMASVVADDMENGSSISWYIINPKTLILIQYNAAIYEDFLSYKSIYDPYSTPSLSKKQVYKYNKYPSK